MIENKKRPLNHFRKDTGSGWVRTHGAINDLSLNLPKENVPHHTSAEVIDNIGEDLLATQLRVIKLKDLDLYLNQGFIPSNRLGETLNVSQVTALKFINSIEPDWLKEYYTFPEGSRRIRLVPPGVVDKLFRYKDLDIERRMLGTWRGWQARNSFCLPEDDLTKLQWSAISLNLLKSRDIINLNDEDLLMLVQIIHPNIIGDIVNDVFKKWRKEKTMREAIVYAAKIIPKVSDQVSYESDNFNIILTNLVCNFIEGAEL